MHVVDLYSLCVVGTVYGMYIGGTLHGVYDAFRQWTSCFIIHTKYITVYQFVFPLHFFYFLFFNKKVWSGEVGGGLGSG